MLAINKASSTHNKSCSGQGEVSKVNVTQKVHQQKESGGTNAAQIYREIIGKK